MEREFTAIERLPSRVAVPLELALGEFSVAKNVDVATRSGWFSCRSLPLPGSWPPCGALQHTGFARRLPLGEGRIATH